MTPKIGIINVSDRASQGVYEDIPGKEALKLLREYIISDWEPVYAVVPDEIQEISKVLIRMADIDDCCFIVTTGGTGPALRDVTPEATEEVCNKILPGFGEKMRFDSLQYTATSILSRQVAGIRNKCLILNLPGKPKAIKECLDVVFPVIPHCITLLEGPFLECSDKVEIVRPKIK